jgi:uncharacterized phage protein (TIGR02218 family)
MSRIWFAQELETVATYWRVNRLDGVAFGFTNHDSNLWFDGVLHLATPGMTPTAIRRTAGFEADSAEIDGAIAHEALDGFELASGRYDNARVVVGLVDWQTLEHKAVYSGKVGAVSQEAGRFVIQLLSRKAELACDPIPRTSPCCRADFCGRECGLSAPMYEHEGILLSLDSDFNLVTLASGIDSESLLNGTLRWMDGPYAGVSMGILGRQSDALLLDQPIDRPIPVGSRAILREGCDHTLATCGARFANAVNFRGEPFLPGNDLLIRYGAAS